MILTLSHGQASVERGFSLNNSILKTNISAESIISRRIVKDHILSHQVQPHTIEINNPMIVAYKSARLKYTIHMEEEKKEKEKTATENQAMHLNNDINKIQQKCTQLKKAMGMMQEECFQCFQMAEEKSDLSYAIKGNGLKRSHEQSQKQLEILENEIKVLEEKKRKLS